ncbi:hypothetical protein [Trichormus sp. NMC-1]|uniref:hypothetical protein n=1 Tax=Trichormus sp. NMC-1 TaxID=1853259 RepID=UPI0015A5584D|nr:hypothetical protein [Trichormus sp. NMC-1]
MTRAVVDQISSILDETAILNRIKDDLLMKVDDFHFTTFGAAIAISIDITKKRSHISHY